MELLFDELGQGNQQLQQEIMLHQQAEESLGQIQQELELRVAERTAELVEANRRLQQEIEQRKQVEATLQQRERQWQALFEHTLDAIAIVDDEGRYVEVNPAACELFGSSREELLRSQIADFAKPGFDFAQAWQHFTEQGQMQGEFSIHRPDGEIRETEFSAVANFIPHRHLSILRDISDRKQTQKTLQESEERLQLALRAASIGIWDWNFQTNKVMWSDHLFSLFGLTPDTFDVSYENFLKIVHPEDSEFLQQSVRRSINEQAPYDIQFRVIFPDGTIRWSDCKGKILYDDTGQPLRMIGVNIDITNRKQFEKNLQESEERFRALSTSAPIAICRVDLHNNGLYSNPHWHKLSGLSAQESLGRGWMQAIHPEDKEALSAAWESYRRGEQEFLHEYRLLTPQGKVHWVIGRMAPIRAATGEIVGYVSVKEDITKRKQAEQKIREQAALIDIATDAIFVRDLENRILFWNKGAERLYGWTTEESFGKKAHELFYRESSLQLEAVLQATIEHGSWQGELEQITKSGKEIIVASRWTLVSDELEKPQSILVVNTDITEKKQLEQKFYRAQRLESVGTLASGIAHDLNNVFTPIMMIAQLLPLRCKNVDPRTQQMFQTLETNAKRGSNLVKQILTFARGTEGKHILLQPGHLLKELTKVIKQTFPKSIEIDIDIPTNTLWMVKADPTQLDQVFMNLAVNARDAMSNSGKLTITAENRIIDQTYAGMQMEAHVGGYIVVTFADTGTGIPPELLERIFDPFFTTKEVGKGTGLGLSTVLGIVKNHGGFVEVSSQVGKGAKFQVFLPRGEGTAIEASVDKELPTGNGELILVVDDEVIVQQITQGTLADYNYKTLVANDGIEAIALYVEHQSKISAVLLDMFMPNMDGLTAIRTLRTLNPKVKIVASSGLFATEQKAIAAGADKFLSKPYTATDLLTTLLDVIKKY